MPETWYALDGQIHITNPDGTEDILSTCWAATRLVVELEEKQKRVEVREAVQQHQTEKREKASKKKSGRGC